MVLFCCSSRTDATNPAPSIALMTFVIASGAAFSCRLNSPRCSGRFTVSSATPSTALPTRSTGLWIAVYNVPITRVHGEASASAGAHPTDLIPSLTALGPGVNSLHFTGAITSLSFHSGHGFWFIVVNINPLCESNYLSGAKSSKPAQMSKPRNRQGNTWPNWTTGGCSPL